MRVKYGIVAWGRGGHCVRVSWEEDRGEREKHFYSASGTLKIEIREIKIKQLQSLESEESGIN